MAVTDATRFPCPCCGYLTLEEEPPGTFDICPVCHWEDDNVQFDDPSREGGANRVSLTDARRNYLQIGASSPDCLEHVREPLPNERPGGLNPASDT